MVTAAPPPLELAVPLPEPTVPRKLLTISEARVESSGLVTVPVSTTRSPSRLDGDMSSWEAGD